MWSSADCKGSHGILVKLRATDALFQGQKYHRKLNGGLTEYRSIHMFMFDPGGLEDILVLKGGIGLVNMLQSTEQQFQNQ